MSRGNCEKWEDMTSSVHHSEQHKFTDLRFSSRKSSSSLGCSASTRGKVWWLQVVEQALKKDVCQKSVCVRFALLSVCANDSFMKSKLSWELLSVTWHLDLGGRLKCVKLRAILRSLFFFFFLLVCSPHTSICFSVLIISCLLLTFISFLFPPSLFPLHCKRDPQTGSVMNVVKAGLTVFSLSPSSSSSSLHWCLSGSDHLTQVFHIMPVPPSSLLFPPFPLVHPGSFLVSSHDVFRVISSFQNKGMQRRETDKEPRRLAARWRCTGQRFVWCRHMGGLKTKLSSSTIIYSGERAEHAPSLSPSPAAGGWRLNPGQTHSYSSKRCDYGSVKCTDIWLHGAVLALIDRCSSLWPPQIHSGFLPCTQIQTFQLCQQIQSTGLTVFSTVNPSWLCR